ncbi:MAG: ankyrin repeat domain-containing protein [bacterium]
MQKLVFTLVVLSISLIFSKIINAQSIYSLLQAGENDTVRILIEKNPGLIAEKNSQQMTLLHWAALSSNKEILNYLIDKGAVIDEKDGTGTTALGLVVFSTGNFEMAKILIDKGADINSVDIQNVSILRKAAAKGNNDIINYLMEKGVAIPSPDEQGGKVLFRNSVRNDLSRLVDVMITKGADVFEKDADGSNLLHYAASGGSSENIKRLLHAGIKINEYDNFGWSPLHYAAAANKIDAVESLLENGADINARTNDGYTAYNLASEIGYNEISCLLISKGADTGDPNYSRPHGLYFGEPLPGTTPQKFAPKFISRDNLMVYACSFSPDGKEYYFTRGTDPQKIMVSRLEKEGWTFPTTVTFSDGFSAHEPHVTLDNEKIYWGWFRKSPEQDESTAGQAYGIYMSERISNGWSNAMYVGDGMYVTSTRDGDVFVSGLRKVHFENDRFKSLEPLLDFENNPIRGEHPCIAPDGSYILYDEFGRHLYVRFKLASGNWSRPVDLAKHGIEASSGIASISPDGKYLFFGNNGSIFWVSTKLIDDLREEALKDE